MFTKKKPLVFTKKSAKPDVENAADAKKPGDAKEDGKKPRNMKKAMLKGKKKPVGKQAAFWAAKAASSLTKG